MQLSTFIRDNIEPLLAEWEAFARTLLPATKDMTVEQLRNHARQLLEAIASDLDTPQSAYEQTEKSQGRVPQPPDGQDSAAQIHAGMRADSRLTLNQMVSEYRAMRASVLRLWSKATHGNVGAGELEQMTRFNEAIDQALTESTARFNTLLNRDRDLFLAALGHDLRTPLGTILMSANIVLTSATLNEQYRVALKRILNSGTRMKEMVNDLLDFTITRMNGRLKIAPMAVDLGVLARRIADEIKGFHPENEFQVLVEGDLRGNWDEVRLGQLIANLLLNAVQHGTGNAPITITVQDEADQVRLVVHNAGKPISAELLPGIFEPLKRGNREEEDAAAPPNLGLGLYIVREIVLGHGGSIHVTSTEQEGTAFTVQLPRYPTY
jgi:signal transduction histidine kinase